MNKPNINSYQQLIELALKEDLGPGDITSIATIPPDRKGSANLVFRQPGVLSGLCVVENILPVYDKNLTLHDALEDSQFVTAGTTVAQITGPLRSLLAAERVILNFLQRLSGIATLTARYVEAAKGTPAKICDTRKTTPAWRSLEKYAVRCGGGSNHRLGLYDAALIKDNHLAAMDCDNLHHALQAAVQKLRRATPPPDFIEVEVDNLNQLTTVLQVEAVDMILLDNMSLEELATAVKMKNAQPTTSKILLEASGNITLKTVPAVAQTGVDRISVGALTHSSQNLDIALDLL